MNYNDYDSDGNKKNYNFSDMMSDKKQRSRLILAFYAVVIIILVIMIRVGSGSNTTQNNEENSKDNSYNQEIETDDNKEVQQLFSLIDTNNYEFNYTLNFDNEIYIASGKRNNDKFSFTFVKEGETPIEFLGTKNNIKAKVNEEEQEAGFPYQYLNYFDNELLKRIIKNSSKVEDELYVITNSKLKTISNDFHSLESDSLNTIKLTIKNNTIIGIEIDYSNAISELLNREVTAVITNQYTNFNLVDDFSSNFE